MSHKNKRIDGKVKQSFISDDGENRHAAVFGCCCAASQGADCGLQLRVALTL